ncbi:DUF6336 family protein [Streptomyces sp. NPDC057002]|uniref:DUF6336 family protein n=1 Tax=Streptomyces sp. NPDC057002 TaxID=3345992 RepID=UPI00362F4742
MLDRTASRTRRLQGRGSQGPAGLFGAIFLVVGGGFWWAGAADVRRLRDWHTITGQAASVTYSGFH